MERSYGSFSRTVPLPSDANPEDIATDYSEGVVTVAIGKLESAAQERKGTRIPVA